MRHRSWFVGWIALIGSAIYLFARHRAWVHGVLGAVFAQPPALAWAAYLLCGAVRGFTFIPATTLVLVALPFLPPTPLFITTLAGIMISSAGLYQFSDALGMAGVFERRHAATVARVRQVLSEHELPILIGWSFFPVAPTDLICYVAGVLRINFWKFLAGVTIGEGAICALYIYGGDHLLRWWHVR